jgi:hypothetical protein
VDAIAPPPNVIAVLRAIARTGFGYQRAKELGEAAGWHVVDEERDLGYVAFEVRMDPASDKTARRVAVEISESDRPRVFVPLFYFEESETTREPFDLAFRSILDQLVSILGQPSTSGQYGYPHRKGWPYSYAGWRGGDATFVLVQDEFDIQFGMDVSLWVLPAGALVELPVSGA